MVNTEWTIKQIMRSPVALVFLGFLLTVIAVLCRVIMIQDNKIDRQQTQLIVCKEEAALIIGQQKDEHIKMLIKFRSEQDSTRSMIGRLNEKRKRK